MTKNETHRNILYFFLVWVTVLPYLAGCTQAEKISMQAIRLGRFIQHQFAGEHYLQTRDYSKGEIVFQEEVQKNPQNPSANYYLGRFLLAQEKHREALPYFEKAASLSPGNDEYTFWLGVGYGENGLPVKERQAYQSVLKNDPKHLQSLIYLAHNYLKNKQYGKSLDLYHKALKEWPESPSALYNRALIFKILGRTPEEQKAWAEYLTLYPAGSLAQRAADHLNETGDFSYRNQTLAARKITLTKISFEPFTAKLDSTAHPSLKLVGATAANMGKGTLQVVVYQKNNEKLAREKALSVKKYLQQHFPDLRNGHIMTSWFAVPEEYTINGRKVSDDESVRFFLTNV